jgi:hypothetical protein
MTEMSSNQPGVLPFVTRLIQYVVSFGVAFAAGLAPLLGKARVRGFSALIDIYPVDVQDWLIPVSGLLMGMIAVIIKFAASRRPSAKKLSRWFGRTVIVFGSAFIVILVIYLQFVTRVETTVTRRDGTADRTSAAVVTGSREVPQQPPGSPCTCLERQSASQCVQAITINPMNVRACFGEQRVAFATLALSVVYLLLTGSFVAAICLLYLSDLEERRSRARRK